jgi:hypothetical protein
VAFLLGKLLIYSASASYHLVEWRSLEALRASHALDLALVPVSIYAGVAPYADSVFGLGFWGEVALLACVTAANTLVVACHFSPQECAAGCSRAFARLVAALATEVTYGHVAERGGRSSSAAAALASVGAGSPRGAQLQMRLLGPQPARGAAAAVAAAPGSASGPARSASTAGAEARARTMEVTSGLRHGLIALYAVYVFLVSGRALGFSGAWALTLALYLASFGLAKKVDDAGLGPTPREPVRSNGRSGYFVIFLVLMLLRVSSFAWQVCLPHHQPCVWSLHEDFHALLLGADTVSAFAAVKFLYPAVDSTFRMSLFV